MHEKLLRLIVPNSKQFSLFLKHVAKEKIDSLSDLQQQLAFVANDPATASLDTDAAIDLLPTRSPLKYLGDKIKQLLKKPTTKEVAPSIVKKTIQQQAIKNPFTHPAQPVKKAVHQLQTPVKKPSVHPVESKKPLQQVQQQQHIKKSFVRPVQAVKKPAQQPAQIIKNPVQPLVQITEKPIVPSVLAQPVVQTPQTSPAIKKHIHKHYPHPKRVPNSQISVVSVPTKPVPVQVIPSSQNRPISTKPIPRKPISRESSSDISRPTKSFVRSPRKKASPQRYKSDFLE